MPTRWRIGNTCSLNGYGVWRILRFDKDYPIIWLTGVDEEAKVLCRLTEDGTVGVSVKELTPLPEQGDTLL